MAQPVWVTPPGTLGTIPAGKFYQTSILAVDPSETDTVYYKLIAGTLPDGIEFDPNGIITGVPNDSSANGVPLNVFLNTTSKFAIRAYTTKVVDSVVVINRLVDRTFELTVATQNTPAWVTPAGTLGDFFVGEYLKPGIQLDYLNDNTTGIPPAVTLVSGELPAGLSISPTGLIYGLIGNNPAISVLDGFSRDGQGYDQYPFDFNTSTINYNYTFSLQVTNGKISALRTFSMYVYSTATFVASTTLITADSTTLDASISSLVAPVITNTQGSIGTGRVGNFFAYEFLGVDINDYTVNYQGFDLPPGMFLDNQSGFLYGYLQNTTLTSVTYDFSVEAYQAVDSTVRSDPYFYSLTVAGPVNSEVTWISPAFLGEITNGSISRFTIRAFTPAGLPLQYRLLSGSNSKLPQGLQLLPSGNIVGRVSFDTFAIDGGTTTFDLDRQNRNLLPTTFDLTFKFTVNAYSSDQLVNVNKEFTIRVVRAFDTPFDNLYIQCMPPAEGMSIINNLLQNTTIFNPDLLYRKDDPYFGVAKNVVYYHAYGLNSVTLDEYVTALELNHYWKNLVLGEIKTARAIDPLTDAVIYEVVYSEVIDNLVNNDGESVGKEVVLPYPLNPNTLDEQDVVYPNALVDMRQQVIDTVGQESNILPLWMLSKQADGNVLGFTPAWVIAYTQPGAAGLVAYNIQQTYGTELNKVDYEADRYELDNLLTKNWNREDQEWRPTPPTLTTFDIATGETEAVGWTNNTSNVVAWLSDTAFPATWTNNSGQYANGTIFDGGSLQFVDPVDMYTVTTAYDKYLMFPKQNILV